jgi:hypothetical protein
MKQTNCIFASGMKSIRNHIIGRLLCLLMALHVFNCSVDMPDAQQDDVAEDLFINDMESVIEIVLEQGVGIKDAIAEHDEPDDQSPTNIKPSLEFCSYHSPGVNITLKKDILPDNLILYKKTFIKEYITEIIPPPPKA